MNAKKRYGQNFLANKKYLQQMADILSDIPSDVTIVEIGPGKGALTEYLLKLGNRLICVEIDSDMIEVLNKKFDSFNQFTLVNSDIMKFELPDDIDKFVIVGNVPYYISFDILDFVVANRARVVSAYFTFQKEFVQKLTAGLGTKQYGFLTCYIAMFYKATQCFKIPASAFSPKPKIDSAFVKLERLAQPYLVDPDLKKLKSFLRGIFSQRRKKLSNILSSRSFLLEPDNIEGLDTSLRPESVGVEWFARIFGQLS